MTNYYRLHEYSIKELNDLKVKKQKEAKSLESKFKEFKERNNEVSQIKRAIEKKEQENLEKNFTLKEAHIKLLKETLFEYIDHGDLVKFGVEGKRPFGNSDYYEDMVRILGFNWKKDDNGQYTEEQYKKLENLLKELPLAVNHIIEKININFGSRLQEGTKAFPWTPDEIKINK